nr:DUF4450 domain-containing protein [Xylanibacter muris]
MTLTAMPVAAQKKIGDFIESKSYNDDKRGTDRQLNYIPDGDAFVCVNGNNRFTRALYGGHTDYRVETSDRPIFAVVKKGHHRNIRFIITHNGKELQLDSAEYCEARYADGMRTYTVKDKTWNGGTVRLTVVAPMSHEGAIWKFDTDGFSTLPKIKAMVCAISVSRLHRNGDIGVDKPGCFEADKNNKDLETKEWTSDGTSYFMINLSSIVTYQDAKAAEKAFRSAADESKALASRVRFCTPDPYINTLGGALVTAADGDWDGQTWLHGCIGWRMPLAGWRAGYLGDVLGWNDRAVKHFDAYAKSQVTDVAPTMPHPTQDPKMHMARAEKKWGTQMYSNGYICRNPERNNQMHHYDMNLNYMDELLWHFCYDADTAYMRKMWPVIKSHLAWEKRNYDPDNDGLYDAYCCIWASDALYYSGGAVTHSSAYNYRGNRLAARIAEIIGEDPKPYKDEAERIIKAMNERLWIKDKGHWAEYQDYMGLKRRHESAALWSIYTPIDCGAGSLEQFYDATKFIDGNIPHINVTADGTNYGATISTSNWLPYSWSINNVAAAEVMHTALAYFEAGRSDAAFNLMKANIMDQMYIGSSPGNFGQISFYDAARGECYRDFGDCIGISSRTLLQGLFGIIPDAMNGKCVIRPGFPTGWNSASVTTPYIEYKYKRLNGKDIYEITQNFSRPLTMVVRQNIGNGKFREITGTAEKHQIITADIPVTKAEYEKKTAEEFNAASPEKTKTPSLSGLDEPATEKKFRNVDICALFNSNVDDIFKNKYMSPRPPFTTLQIPVQGMGEWCHPDLYEEINDSVFRTLIKDGKFTVAGVPFITPAKGQNIIYTSLWENYPESTEIELKGKAESIYLLMAGSTNHMQSRIANGIVTVTYKDGTKDTLTLENPDNWCPIEQDYFIDGKAFHTTTPRPYRVCLGTGMVSRDLGKELKINGVYGRSIKGGAAQMLRMHVNPKKKLKSLTVKTLSNDVVIGLMGVTLQ